MVWVVAAVLAVFLLPRVLRARDVVAIFPWQPISTLHSAWSKRTSKETKAALDAATSLLR
jgi:hypothetical protein